MTEGDHASHDGPPHPLVFLRGTIKVFTMGGNLARGFAHGNGPGMGRAHHNALEHGLAADQGLLATLQRRQQLDGHEETPDITQKTHDI